MILVADTVQPSMEVHGQYKTACLLSGYMVWFCP